MKHTFNLLTPIIIITFLVLCSHAIHHSIDTIGRVKHMKHTRQHSASTTSSDRLNSISRIRDNNQAIQSQPTTKSSPAKPNRHPKPRPKPRPTVGSNNHPTPPTTTSLQLKSPRNATTYIIHTKNNVERTERIFSIVHTTQYLVEIKYTDAITNDELLSTQHILIPDFQTLNALNFQYDYTHNWTIVLSPDEIASYARTRNIQRIKFKDDERELSPQYQLDILIQKSKIQTYPQPQWLNLTYLPNRVNPALIQWHGKELVVWRSGRFQSVIRFQWYDFSKAHNDNQLETILRVNEPNKTIHIPWLGLPVRETQEDARLIILPKTNRLLLTYSFYHELAFGIAQQACVEVSWDSKTEQFSFSNPYHMQVTGVTRNALIYRDDKLTKPFIRDSQKNWMPFYHEEHDAVYYIVSVSPWRIAKYPGRNAETIGNYSVHPMHILQPEHSQPSFPLPWNTSYGEHIRGGTPAVRISKDLYLAMFHTQIKHHGRSVYFMGGMTFCAKYPFKLHAMHSSPIIFDKFYKPEQEVNRDVMYVVFPMGLVLDERDPLYVWLSVGNRDKDGFSARLNVNEMVQGMILIQT